MSAIRDAWADGRTAFGVWIMTSSPAEAEILALGGFEYLCVDLQHGLLGYEGMREILLATHGVPVSPLVRVPANDHAWIGKALDSGAEGVIVPLVNSRADAEAAAAACRYPPDGIRSFALARGAQPLGRVAAEINERALCFAMIETRTALESAEDICATPGVDGIYVGPSDLALSLGLDPTSGEPGAEHAAAVERVLQACRTSGIVPGIHAPNGTVARQRSEQGFRLVTVCADRSLLARGADRELQAARE